MGSVPSKRRSSFRRNISSLSSTRKTTADNTNLLTELIENNGDVPPQSEKNSAELKTPKSDTEHTIILSSEQTDKQTDKPTDNMVMLRYTVNCKNEHSDPIDIVVIEDNNQISTVVREKVVPGGGASFEVLVFKQPVGGKVYVHV